MGMTRQSNLYTGATISYMRMLARRGLESRDAWEMMVNEGKLPKDSRLDTFRHAASRARIEWANPNAGRQVISILVSANQAHVLEQASLVRGLTRSLLVQRLVETIIDDNMFNAILDDANDPQQPNNT